MRITKVLSTIGLNGFYADDKAAIRAGAEMDGFVYRGAPVTEGFTSIRQPGESSSVMLVLENGEIAFGDSVAVQYAATGGRDRAITGEVMSALVRDVVAPFLEGRDITTFREMSRQIDELGRDRDKLHTSVCYGASQAVLDAVAKVRRLTPAEVICEEYDLTLAPRAVRINAQSGDDRYTNVDKMILKKAGFMPQALLNNVEKVGADGSKFVAYAGWVANRIRAIGEPGFEPTLRFDCYGMLGTVFDNDVGRIVDCLAAVRAVTAPFDLVVEMPVDMGDTERQVTMMRAIRKELCARDLKVELMIDEYANTLDEIKYWADSDACDMIQVKMPDLGAIHNTVEAVLYCKNAGKKVYQGGSCTETDQSARLSANVAMATQPFACSGKPGMGVDEAMMIVGNEMQRILRIAAARPSFELPTSTRRGETHSGTGSSSHA